MLNHILGEPTDHVVLKCPDHQSDIWYINTQKDTNDQEKKADNKKVLSVQQPQLRKSWEVV